MANGKEGESSGGKALEYGKVGSITTIGPMEASFLQQTPANFLPAQNASI